MKEVRLKKGEYILTYLYGYTHIHDVKKAKTIKTGNR